ncbi:rho family-interacting cell polarization regulator 1-like [Cottoperca gobio]|uniref:Rho family-interacting cell polarization regulator 1-like n=1 Tax=Cottoperca gobio TaxID=56716 RepID=A0A6J2RXM5_COTGO|nr:rho family-interacting cell polarization regulator 1-like [Cottoperca gobio]XP_029314193.1 rho family-interacting cell polarization regulator 1-like [Cottoperca gobio]XP_029314202.1 rho family-interacting cell polarization regulator 1-like [Cottoperca gobio]XP_029314210.1 rho family-interacting cell polarization regulator 1-like [Cottoperca gobio]
MFTGSTKLPPTKTPQPERLDEVYAALRRGLQSYLQVHQLELDSLGQQTRENKRNGRLGSLYELDKQVKAIERFMRRLEFHLSKVEELYDAYCIQRRLRDGASKMVAAFNSATGSKEARESLSEANKGYRECTEHMCSLESELESQMGEFHVKMKGLAGFARLCAGDQYEVLMRYGRQRWRLRGRVEVSNKQIWDSEDYIFLPLVTELLSIKVTELKSLANHVVVGSVSCEMLDLFCPLPQTLAVDINDLGTVKLNLEVTWSPFDKDDQTSSTSTVTKRLLSNQSPPDTPSMREQVFYSLLKRQGEMENGTVWSNSSESSDDSSSPALAHHAQRLTASNMLQTTLTSQLSFTPHKSSASTPSLSSNQEEDETEAEEVFSQTDAVPNGHLQTSCSHSPDCTAVDRASIQSADLSDTSADLSCSYPDVSSAPPVSLMETQGLCESGVPQVCISAEEVKESEESSVQAGQTEAETEDRTTDAGKVEALEKYSQSVQESKQPQDAPTVPFPASSSFTLEVETALESFDFLNCSDFEEDEEEEKNEERQEDEGEKKKEDDAGQHEENQNKMEEEEKDKDDFYSGGSDEEEADGLQILMEAPEGFRNSDEDRFSESQESSVEDVQDLCQIEMPEEKEHGEEKGDEQHGEDTSHGQEERPATPTHLATTVF